MPIRGILFDKDGTLLDHDASWAAPTIAMAELAAEGDAELAARMLAHGGFDPVTRRFKSGTPLAAGTPPEIAAAFEAVLGRRGRPDLVAAIDALFSAASGQSTLLPGVRQALLALRPRLDRLGLATSDSLAGLERSLAPHAILELFDFRAGWDSGFGRKPDPGMVEAFCRDSGLRPAEVCVVGDNPHDTKMGRAAGAGLVIGVLSGTSAAADLEDSADLILASVAEMPASAAFVAHLAAE